jgi:hypothetical protein
MELDLAGVDTVGLALGIMLVERTVHRSIITGHDFRSYSKAIHPSAEP